MINDRSENTLLRGIGASAGITTGEVVILDRARVSFPKLHLARKEVSVEVARLRQAITMSIEQLRKLERSVEGTNYPEHAKILEAHALMLQDDLLVKGTEELISLDLINAEWALSRTLQSIQEFFTTLEDAHFRGHQTDIESVGERIMGNLTGQRVQSLMELLAKLDRPTVLVARMLTPADTIQLHHTNVVGFVTDEGTKTTHTAIVARSMEMPAVVGAKGISDEVKTRDIVVIDGDRGDVCVRPSPAQKAAFLRRHRKVSAVRKRLGSRRRPEPAVTKDNFEVTLTGNIDLIDELSSVEARGGLGIGLYRTEYLFLNRRDIPSEQEQYRSYREVLKRAYPAPATIRTLDIGGDKLDWSADVGEQLNPFLGLRAIRYCLEEKSLFRTQLRALLRASVHGTLRLLIPFVTDVTEIRAVKVLLEEVRLELKRDAQPYAEHIELGAMIEIPSAALTADTLAREVDFFSVGTNDLIQYTLAVSRETTEGGHLYHPLQPALLRLLRLVSDAAHREGIRLCMCGEMAGEAVYAAVLLGFRFHELSMNSRSIPIVREVIERMRLDEARELVDRLFPLATYTEVENEVETYMLGKFPDLSPVFGGALGDL